MKELKEEQQKDFEIKSKVLLLSSVNQSTEERIVEILKNRWEDIEIIEKVYTK